MTDSEELDDRINEVSAVWSMKMEEAKKQRSAREQPSCCLYLKVLGKVFRLKEAGYSGIKVSRHVTRQVSEASGRGIGESEGATGSVRAICTYVIRVNGIPV